MDFEFQFPITMPGPTIGHEHTIQHIPCVAVIDALDYDENEWGIYEIIIDDLMLPQRHYLRQPMIEYLTTPEMMKCIDHAWDDHLAQGVLEGI